MIGPINHGTTPNHYDQNWKINNSNFPTLPFYSMVNGLYVGDLNLKDQLDLSFTPQSRINTGIIVSVLSLAIILSVCFILKLKGTKRKY